MAKISHRASCLLCSVCRLYSESIRLVELAFDPSPLFSILLAGHRWSNISLLLGSWIYFIYNCQVMHDPTTFNSNYLYVYGDIMYFLSSVSYDEPQPQSPPPFLEP